MTWDDLIEVPWESVPEIEVRRSIAPLRGVHGAYGVYKVPFEVDRSTPPWFRFANCGRETLRGVTVTEVLGGRVVRVTSPRSLEPGAALPFTASSVHPEVATVAVLRWIRPSGDEYLWRVAF